MGLLRGRVVSVWLLVPAKYMITPSHCIVLLKPGFLLRFLRGPALKLRVQKWQQNDKWYEGLANCLRDSKQTSEDHEKVLEQTAYPIAAKVRKDHGLPDLTVHEALKFTEGIARPCTCIQAM